MHAGGPVSLWLPDHHSSRAPVAYSEHTSGCDVDSRLARDIAGLGIYGVLSHSVGERTREIGVRLALGAPESRVRRLVAGQSMAPVLAGIAGGVLALTIGSQIISSWIFGVTPEPLAIAAVAVELTLVAAVASAVPAWRASRLDPVTALRHD